MFLSDLYLNYLEQQGGSSEPWPSFLPNCCLCFPCFPEDYQIQVSFCLTDNSGQVASDEKPNFHFQRISKRSTDIDNKMIILLIERQLFFELQKTITDQLPT